MSPICLLLVLSASAEEPAFKGAVRSLSAATVDQMTGKSYHTGCPIGLDSLSEVSLTHWGFDGAVHSGLLIVERTQAAALLTVFESLFNARYPLHSVKPVYTFNGDDDASMAANNTSAFNCRRVAGTSRWSEHSYGRAIDVNPVQNPYVRGSKVQPEAGRAFAERPHSAGVIHADDEVVAAFAEAGWSWGGVWTRSRDYQHFSLSGR